MFPIRFPFHDKLTISTLTIGNPWWFESYKFDPPELVGEFCGAKILGNWTIILKGKEVEFKHLLHVFFWCVVFLMIFGRWSTFFYLARWPNLTTCFLWVVTTHHFGTSLFTPVRWVTGSWGRGLDCNSWHHRSRFEATKGAEQVWLWCFGWGRYQTKTGLVSVGLGRTSINLLKRIVRMATGKLCKSYFPTVWEAMDFMSRLVFNCIQNTTVFGELRGGARVKKMNWESCCVSISTHNIETEPPVFFVSNTCLPSQSP